MMTMALTAPLKLPGNSINHIVALRFIAFILPSCRKFIASQQQRPGKDRGPHLAELELQCRLLARRDAAAKEGRGMMDLLVDYFERFGSKPCCMTDLKLYVSSLESSERDEFFSRTAECISLTDKGVPSTVRLLRQYVRNNSPRKHRRLVCNYLIMVSWVLLKGARGRTGRESDEKLERVEICFVLSRAWSICES